MNNPGEQNLDLFTLRLFEIVAETGSFTLAGRRAGLTQSAVSRQIQRLEASVHLRLLDRTTRRITPTAAGRYLLARGRVILGDVAHAIRRLEEEFAQAPASVRVGLSHSIGLAHLPGLLFAYPRLRPEVQLQIAQREPRELLAALEEDRLDVGVMSVPRRMNSNLRVIHRFRDQFVFIVPPGQGEPSSTRRQPASAIVRQLAERPWLMLAGEEGEAPRRWLRAHGLKASAAMELEGFDLIASLVSIGLGVSLVPQRVLSMYARNNRKIVELHSRQRFEREVAVVIRREQNPAAHIRDFVEAILFRE